MTNIDFNVENHIATITINRPEARNSLTMEMYRQIASHFGCISLNEGIKAVIIRGAGDKAFAAGTDMTEFRGFSKDEDALNYEKDMEQILTTIEKCPVPTIAAITGACTGGGAAIACACDIRISDNRLKFGFPIARTLGNCLSVTNLNRISRVTGAPKLKEILLTARLIESSEALNTQIVSEIFDTPDEVFNRACELAATMTRHAPLTMMASKEALRRLQSDGFDANDDDLVTACYLSSDFQNGLEAFLKKQKYDWKGQ